MVEKDGGPAFPTVLSVEVDGSGTFASKAVDGMSLRDYFAGQALVGMLTAPPSDSAGMQDITARAYRYADAMLTERAK